jgi:hypothetical protein
LRRSVRERRLPERYTPYDFYSIFSLSIIDDDPRIVREAVDSEDGNLWKKAKDEEMDALDKNEVWYLVKFPTGRNPLGRKWVFKKKLNSKGKVEKHKCRLVAKGYSQVKGIGFGDIFSHVAKLTSIRFMLFFLLHLFLSRIDGCEDNIPTWGSGRRNLYKSSRRIWCEGKEGVGMQAEKFLVWFITITKDVI